MAHTVHNSLIILSLAGLYFIFAVLMLHSRRASPSNGQSSDKCSGQSMAFVTVFFVSAVNGVGCAIYVFMQFFPSQTGLWLIHSASYVWLTVHGMPAVIYLLLNKTIRSELSTMVKGSVRACKPCQGEEEDEVWL